MTSPENAVFYRDVLGIPPDEAEHVDDVHPCLIPVSHDETDRILKRAGIYSAEWGREE